MKNLLRANTKRLTEQWDKCLLKDCYCLIFSPVYGFQIIWNDEDGFAHSLDDKSKVLVCYFVVLAVYETEKQAKEHLKDFVKWVNE